MFKKNMLMGLAVLVALTANFAFADDDLDTKIKNKSEDVKADAKKSVRKAKKEVRKARGTNTPLKDAKDSVNDAKDDVEKSGKKLQNKLDE